MNTLQKQVKGIIDEELAKSGITTRCDINAICITQKIVVEHDSESEPPIISEAILNHHFPRISDALELAHFTSFDACFGILNSNALHLCSILKRINEQEFQPFSQAHGLDGYLATSNGEPYYQTLMRDLFYTSFTERDPKDEAYMWNIFAKGGTGAKLIFRVKVNQRRSELRPILYHSSSSSPTTLIKTLSDRILNECGRHFIPRGISRIGAFYLPLGLGLENEDETRLLIKAWDYGPARDLVIGSDANAYIPLALGDSKNQFCDLELLEIQAGPKADNVKLQNILEQTGWDKKVNLLPYNP